MPRCARFALFPWLAIHLVPWSACESPGDAAPFLAVAGASAVTVVIPAEASPGLRAAAEDLGVALQRAGGATSPLALSAGELSSAGTRTVVLAEVRPALSGELGEEGYRIERGELGAGKIGLRISAASQAGAMYGLFAVAADLGVRYLEPEQTFYPPGSSTARLPWHYHGSPERPHFALRGFHEHTQHPIPASDFFLRPDPALRAYASHYLRWLARNRQNFVSIQMLKTVDLPSWRPYMKEIIEEARGLHVEVGLVLSFVDEQQNNYKLIQSQRQDGSGKPIAEELQIEQELEAFAALGFGMVVVQIGSSEFTKPDEQKLLGWINRAAQVLARHRIPLHAWVHPLCSLPSDDGGYFYHLPERADPSVGAWVHTTMFYTLAHPAPVYGCQSFAHQLQFLQQAQGKRPQVHFPETAWWLGFDNNLPLALPLTGWSRAHDIQRSLASLELAGHVTFSSGREWGYWQYDHFLTRATWDARLGWSEYLDWMAPAFGEQGARLTAVLKDWTELQRRHFYGERPSIFFYLAGELAQDEIGEVAGILARPPKLAFGKLLAYDDAAFARWKKDDHDLLLRMRNQYAALLERLPPVARDPKELSWQLHHETVQSLRLYLRRIEHAIVLYTGVAAARRWARSDRSDPQLRAGAEAEARYQLGRARAISEEVRGVVAEMEAYYRYPVELLARTKPESLTSYRFGYLFETFTAHFWRRRDDQLELLIEQVFSDSKDAWISKPDHLFVSGPERTELVSPTNPVAATVITGFTPRLLFGLAGDLLGSGAGRLIIAQDANRNLLPDQDTELELSLDKSGQPWRARAPEYLLQVRTSAGELIGAGLKLYAPDFALAVGPDPKSPSLPTLSSCLLAAEVASAQLVDLVVSVAGIDRAGAESLLRSVFGVAAGAPTPERLPIEMRLSFERAELP